MLRNWIQASASTDTLWINTGSDILRLTEAERKRRDKGVLGSGMGLQVSPSATRWAHFTANQILQSHLPFSSTE